MGRSGSLERTKQPRTSLCLNLLLVTAEVCGFRHPTPTSWELPKAGGLLSLSCSQHRLSRAGHQGRSLLPPPSENNPGAVLAPRQIEARARRERGVGKRGPPLCSPAAGAVLLAFIAPSLPLSAPQTFGVFLHLRHGKGRWMIKSWRRSLAAAGELPRAALQAERDAALGAGNSAAESSQLPDSRIHFLDPGHRD